MIDTAPATEQRATFACFGSECTVLIADAGPPADVNAAVARARQRLLEWHDQFSRFQPGSEISRLNADPRATVSVTPMMRRVLQAAVRAANDTGGLVDPTLVGEIERAGYAGHFEGTGIPLGEALSLAPERQRGRPSSRRRWSELRVDRRTSTVTRPPGLRIDPGGIAKGVFADELGATLASVAAYVVDCAGDLRLGGAGCIQRPVNVASPFDERTLHTFELQSGGVATSGIGRRSWLRDGRPAHHLLDPATGEPAFTGVVQATALAPTATEAEARSKAAILSGPDGAEGWLPYGGVVVFDDGSHRAIDPTL